MRGRAFPTSILGSFISADLASWELGLTLARERNERIPSTKKAANFDEHITPPLRPCYCNATGWCKGHYSTLDAWGQRELINRDSDVLRQGLLCQRSLSAGRGIIIKNPAVLEQIDLCRTLIFDKTGTLTYGKPALTEVLCSPPFERDDVLIAAASLERFSKHPLAGAILDAASASNLTLQSVTHLAETPGQGLAGIVAGRQVSITGRASISGHGGAETGGHQLPPIAGGLECVVIIEGVYAALFRFRDAPRRDSDIFVRHLRPSHQVDRVLLVSGDRESEVRYLAESVGIAEVHASQSPEEKLAIVQHETRLARTLFVGDGINDAPALMAATVGVAFGQSSDVTSEAADAVILESSLRKVDELIHIGRRMRSIALQSAVGGLALSIVGMIAAAAGFLPPIAGAVAQELIDLASVLNALRVVLAAGDLTDF